MKPTLLAIFALLASMLSLQAQHQTNQCETVLVFGTGMRPSGAPAALGSVDLNFRGISANFSNAPNAYVCSNVSAWMSNGVSAKSQWIAPGVNPNYPAGTYQYQLGFVTPCVNARVNGRFAAGDRGAVRLNGAGAVVSTPLTGYTNWTAFVFSGLAAGSNRLYFYATNAPGAVGPPGPTGLRVELEVTATCCPCIVLNCPNNMTALTCSNSARVNFTVTGTNRCYTNLNIVCTPPSGSLFPIGNTLVNCDASDTVGHRTNCTFTVTVIQSNTPPAIQCSSNLTLTANPITCRAILSQIPVTVSDDCTSSGSINVSQNPGPGAPLSIGQHTVTIIATDSGNLRSTCTVMVAVCDNVAPVLQCPPGIFFGCMTNGTNVRFSVSATDNCLSPVPVVCNPPSGSFFPPGTNAVVCTASDQCSNVSTCSFNVIITSEQYTMTLQGGIVDNFFGPEPASASACLVQSGVWAAKPFDEFAPTTRPFAHSFQNLPANISGAKLIVHMKPRSPFSVDDVLRIGLTGCAPPGTWAFQQQVSLLPGANGTWTTNPPTTFVLDLAALPGGINLIPQLIVDHRLDFAVGNDTAVDYARLEIKYCRPSGLAGGVPFFVNGAQPVFAPSGIAFEPLQRSVPFDAEWDIGHSDGLEFEFENIPGLGCNNPISNHNGLETVWPTGAGTTATLRMNAAPTNGAKTLVTMSQPSNVSGKAIEVWNNGQLVSRYFLPGANDTGATVPASACLSTKGFTTAYFFAHFTDAVPIDILGGTHISGQVGPTITGDQLRLYFNITVEAQPKYVRMVHSGAFDVSHLRLLREGTWMESYGQPPVTVSDVILWNYFEDILKNPYGGCTSPFDAFWEVEFNGVSDFCTGNPCSDGWVDLEMYGIGPPKYPVGGLRVTPTALPDDDCEVKANGLEGPIQITIHALGTNPVIHFQSNLVATHWPTKVSGLASPNTWHVDFPPVTTVTIGNSVYYNATRATFHASATALDQYYVVCPEVTKLAAFSIKSITTVPSNAPVDCVTISCPTNIVANCDSNGTALVNYTVNAGTRCGSNVTVTCTPPSGSVFPPGVSFVECVATDETGNQDRCRFTVTVRDSMPPRWTGPRRIIVPCEGPGGAVVLFDAGAVDDCDRNVLVTCTPPSGTVFPVGSNTVTCVAVDASGNRTVAAFPVIVLGGCGNSPCIEITLPLSNVVARCISSNGTPVTFNATARDGCTGGLLTVVCNPPSGSLFEVGLSHVICTASNGNNWAAGSFFVEVIDDTPPTINCPSNIVAEAQSEMGAVVSYAVTASDDCATQIRIRCTKPSGSVFPVGSTKVLCRATDANGNVAECAFLVTVRPPRPLRIAQPISNRFEFRWTGDAVLEATDILGEDATWQEMQGTPQSNGTERVLQVLPSGPMKFFRVRALPLLPPPDNDNDGVPDSRDLCPGTPVGLAVNSNGCALLQFVGQPNLALGRQFDLWEDAVGKWDVWQVAGIPGLNLSLTSLSNLAAILLSAHDFRGGLQIESNILSRLRVAWTEFQREKPRIIADLLNSAPRLDKANADVRPQDFQIMDLLDFEDALQKVLVETELNFLSVSNIARATELVLPGERVRIANIDREHNAAILGDGRIVHLPAVQQDGAPALNQIPNVFEIGSEVDIQVSQLPDGSLVGQSADAVEAVDSSPVVAVDPRCLSLRIVPANPSLPDWDSGIRHYPKAYRWGFTEDGGIHFLEYGMAFAAVKLACNAEQPGAYKHWLKILIDSDNDGDFGTLVHSLNDLSAPWVLKESNVQLPENRPMTIIVREFRAPFQGNGYGAPQVVAEETMVIEVNATGFYAEADYSRTIFEIEDNPNGTDFQSATVVDLIRRFPLTMQTLGQQTFSAISYKATGNSSSYPGVFTIGFNDPFAVHFQDPNNTLFFAFPDDVGKGLYFPTVKGVNHGKPFHYHVRLPNLVRDRVHNCSGTDSYYRIPFIGPLPANYYGPWHVSQGNNGEFTHNGAQAYAFDFPKGQGVDVLAARGGIVIKAKESGCYSCWDDDDEECDIGDCEGDYAGNVVKILHQDGTVGVYVHFKKNGVYVSKDQRVYRGDHIGDVGTTGCSTGPHLHFHVTEHKDTGQTIPVRFESFDDDFDFHNCFLPGHGSDGYSTNKPWWWPF